jgi:hypothetical protein
LILPHRYFDRDVNSVVKFFSRLQSGAVVGQTKPNFEQCRLGGDPESEEQKNRLDTATRASGFSHEVEAEFNAMVLQQGCEKITEVEEEEDGDDEEEEEEEWTRRKARREEGGEAAQIVKLAVAADEVAADEEELAAEAIAAQEGGAEGEEGDDDEDEEDEPDLFECENDCGFRGLYDDVAEHEMQCTFCPAGTTNSTASREHEEHASSIPLRRQGMPTEEGGATMEPATVPVDAVTVAVEAVTVAVEAVTVGAEAVAVAVGVDAVAVDAEAVAAGGEEGAVDAEAVADEGADDEEDPESIFESEVSVQQSERKIRFKVKKHLAKRDAAKKRESRNFTKKLSRGKKKLHHSQLN